MAKGILLIKYERELLEIILSSKHIRYHYVKAALLSGKHAHSDLCSHVFIRG